VKVNTHPKTHFLLPGALFCSEESHLVTTVLGSCVAVFLWDAKRQMGGVNHFLLPLWNGEGLATPKYGNIAISRLLENMLALGSTRHDLKAKVFGGACLWGNPEGLLAIGDRNIELARNLLSEQGIPIISSDVGGQLGRKVIFDTAKGSVLLKRHSKTEPTDCRQSLANHL
jgi:chemotaxis protein CheD